MGTLRLSLMNMGFLQYRTSYNGCLTRDIPAVWFGNGTGVGEFWIVSCSKGGLVKGAEMFDTE